MIKPPKADLLFFSLVFILVVITFGSVYLSLYFVFLGGTLLCVIVGLSFEIYNRRHPFIENPEEIKELKKQLDSENVLEFIKESFFDKGRSLRKISLDLEQKFDIELLVQKGFDRRSYKSEELIEKLYHMLGYTSFKEYWEEYHKLKRRKKNKVL